MSNIIEYKGYMGSVEFSSEDGVFYGKVLGLNDLITFEGESVRELTAAFKDSIEDYLETCKELGKDPEKTYKGTFNVRLSSELHKKAAMVATSQNMTLNQFVKFALNYVITHKNSIESDLKRSRLKEDELAY